MTPSGQSLASLLLGDDDVGLPRDAAGSVDYLDVHDAALLEPDAPAELARLRTRGFVSGAVRSWWGGDESVIQITLHRFGTAADAQRSVDDLHSALLAAAATVHCVGSIEVLRVGGVGGGPGVVRALVVLMRTADVVAMVVTTSCASSAADHEGRRCAAIAGRQRERLSGVVAATRT